MAVRLRVQNGSWIALCAAEFPEKLGDHYIDDAQDQALRAKYVEDFKSEGLIDRSFRSSSPAELARVQGSAGDPYKMPSALMDVPTTTSSGTTYQGSAPSASAAPAEPTIPVRKTLAEWREIIEDEKTAEPPSDAPVEYYSCPSCEHVQKMPIEAEPDDFVVCADCDHEGRLKDFDRAKQPRRAWQLAPTPPASAFHLDDDGQVVLHHAPPIQDEARKAAMPDEIWVNHDSRSQSIGCERFGTAHDRKVSERSTRYVLPALASPQQALDRDAALTALELWQSGDCSNETDVLYDHANTIRAALQPQQALDREALEKITDDLETVFAKCDERQTMAALWPITKRLRALIAGAARMKVGHPDPVAEFRNELKREKIIGHEDVVVLCVSRSSAEYAIAAMEKLEKIKTVAATTATH